MRRPAARAYGWCGASAYLCRRGHGPHVGSVRVVSGRHQRGAGRGTADATRPAALVGDGGRRTGGVADGQGGQDPAGGTECGGDEHGGAKPRGQLRGAEGGGTGEAGEQRQDGDGEQTGGAGHDVVHGGRDAGVLGRRGAHGGGRERRDGDGEAEGEEQHGGEHLGPVGPGIGGAREQGQTGGDDERPHRHLEARADAGRQRSRAGREDEHDERHRQQGEAGREGAVALDDLQLDGEQEQGTAEGAVDGEGHGIGPAELAGAEQLERQHRVGAAVLDDEEGGRGHGGEDEAGHHRRARPAARRGLDEPVGQPGQEHDGQAGADGIDPAGAGRVPRLGHVAGRDGEDGGGQREVDVEDPAPGADGEEVAADQRPGGGRQPTEPRPGADGAGAVLGAERRLQDGQAGRGHEGAAHALDHPGGDEERGARGQAAAGRRGGEPGDPDGEDPLAAVAVAE